MYTSASGTLACALRVNFDYHLFGSFFMRTPEENFGNKRCRDLGGQQKNKNDIK